MGLIKVIVALVVGLVLDKFVRKTAEKYKDKSFVKYLKPYIDNKCYVILSGVLLVTLLL